MAYAGTYQGTINTYCAEFNYNDPITFTIDDKGFIDLPSSYQGTLADGNLDAQGKVSGISITVNSMSLGKLTIPYQGSDDGTTFYASGQSSNGIISVIQAKNMGVPPTSSIPGLLETKTPRQNIEAIYIAYFGRAPDKAGFDFWIDQYNQNVSSGLAPSDVLNRIADSFAPQKETQALYPALVSSHPSDNGKFVVNNLSDTAENRATLVKVISDVYRNEFGRAPTATELAAGGGVQYWVDEILVRGSNLGKIALLIANGATGSDATAINNKIQVSGDFLSKTLAAGIGDQPSEVDAEYLSVAKAAVGGVTADAASVQAGGATIDAYVKPAPLNLTGDASNNALIGNAGDNIIDGRAGADTLTGGLGNDTFAFTTALVTGVVDHITDFSPAGAGNDDTIRLARSAFGSLATGPLSASAFKDLGVVGAVEDADDRILYDRTTGILSYDADGLGGAAAVSFAILDNKTLITASDVVVV